jgi:hypothetical protein
MHDQLSRGIKKFFSLAASYIENFSGALSLNADKAKTTQDKPPSLMTLLVHYAGGNVSLVNLAVAQSVRKDGKIHLADVVDRIDKLCGRPKKPSEEIPPRAEFNFKI